jgi:hypothetical protein
MIMRFPGFGPRRTVERDPIDGRDVVVERHADESEDAYEARRRAARDEQADEHRAERHGYYQGRREQRRIDQTEARTRRRGGGFGLVGALVVVVAALGILWVALAAREGSFAAGGALVDQKVAEVTQPARVAATEAVDRTGAAVENAGQALESQGQRLRERAP